MSVSIKIKKEDKDKLLKLQAKLTLFLDKKLTQEEIISYLLQIAEKNENLFIEQINNENEPLSDVQIKSLMNFPEDWEIETSEKDINKILYG